MNAQKNRTYSQISLGERRKIERWHAAKIRVDVIAEKLGRHRSTIFRELKRNKFTDPQMRQLDGYYCLTANNSAQQRRYRMRKLVRYHKLRQAIVDRIKHGWSPEQIAGRLRYERGFGVRSQDYDSHETIYRFAYSIDGQELQSW